MPAPRNCLNLISRKWVRKWAWIWIAISTKLNRDLSRTFNNPNREKKPIGKEIVLHPAMSNRRNKSSCNLRETLYVRPFVLQFESLQLGRYTGKHLPVCSPYCRSATSTTGWTFASIFCGHGQATNVVSAMRIENNQLIFWRETIAWYNNIYYIYIGATTMRWLNNTW